MPRRPTTDTSKLVAETQRLVHSLAVRIHHNLPVAVDLEDLIAYGQVGLAEAANAYRHDEGSQFSTFAYYRIRGAIYDGVSKMSWTSRARMRRLRNESTSLAGAKSGSTFSLAGPANLERADLTPTGSQSSKEELSTSDTSTIADRRDTPAKAIACREIHEKLQELIAKLPDLERRLIQDVYFEGFTIQDVAIRNGLSKSWVSRLHSRILDELGRSLQRIGISEHD